MQAQTVSPGFPAIAAAPNSANAALSSDTSAVVAPQFSQQPYDRWADLPADVAVQVMYWTMLGAGTARWAASFALASKHFAQAGESFRAGPWYGDAQSALMRDSATAWTRAYVGLLGQSPTVTVPKSRDELNAALALLGEGHQGMANLLNIEHPLNFAADEVLPDALRHFRGSALSLVKGVRKDSGEQIVRIAQALPPTVCVCVVFAPVSWGRIKHAGVPDLISRIAATGRATAFDLESHTDLSPQPDELGAVLDVACGPGMVCFFKFGQVADPDAMLRALSDRCESFRDLKLVMLTCKNPPSRAQIEALTDALARRASAGQPRLTVVVGCDKVRDQDRYGTPVFSVDERARFERAGLYLECVESGLGNPRGTEKVCASVRGEPMRELPPQPPVLEIDPSPDSDVIVGSSDSTGWTDSSDDEE